ncbi:MAG TPA: transmembrane 220 family protein [Puia sp.]|nr:transmembrane 220 family protein [Puia sp.]
MVLLILNIVFCLAFLYFAYLNLNDIDPWVWVPIYVAASACCGLTVFGMYFPRVYLVLMAFYILYAVILFFAVDGVRDWIVKYKRPSIVENMQAEKPWIEKTREFFGLLIITGALAVDFLCYR